jgi:hypothetical protein
MGALPLAYSSFRECLRYPRFKPTAPFAGAYLEKVYRCVAQRSQAAHEQAAGIVLNLGLGALGPGVEEFGAMGPPPVGFIEIPENAINAKGKWNRITPKKPQPDCSVTYICRYGEGWDEICDNQRWAIDKIMGGKTVYHYERRPEDTYKDGWAKFYRHAEYRARAQVTKTGENRARCDV